MHPRRRTNDFLPVWSIYIYKSLSNSHTSLSLSLSLSLSPYLPSLANTMKAIDSDVLSSSILLGIVRCQTEHKRRHTRDHTLNKKSNSNLSQKYTENEKKKKRMSEKTHARIERHTRSGLDICSIIRAVKSPLGMRSGALRAKRSKQRAAFFFTVNGAPLQHVEGNA